jgi:tight adherence protein B
MMDSVTLMMMGGILGVLAVSLIGYLILSPFMGQRTTVKQRIEMVSSNASTGALAAKGESRRTDRRRDIQTKLKEIEEAKKAQKLTLSMRYKRDLMQAGFDVSLRTYLLICILLTVVAAMVYLVMGYPLLGVLPVSFTVGFGIPRLVVQTKNKARVKAFTLEFANSLDVIIRGIRSGLPIGECLRIVANESPEPVAGVFREMVEAQNIGLTLEKALERATEQMDTADLKFFAIVLSIQAQTGGNLADTLQNLSNILRERKKMADKVRALSSEAKSSAAIIGSLPFLIALALYFVNNKYLMKLFTEDIGNIMIMGGLIWMGIGILVMRQMINFEI